MKQITAIAIATIGTAALLAGGGGTALAAGRAASSATVSAATAPAAVTDISYYKAAEIARKRVLGGRVTKVEREWEYGQAVWKVELRRNDWEYDVHVSATTGEIIRLKRDHRE
ncbi:MULTISPECIES: PepSY domain-containing protein [Streptosporangium]|uniref:Membrane protein YkoI n=1 Tax=Streptosporangium brasiliense TaxID=47480 RepID=A0ABT9QWQ5_9ACTN|nr:PepSY domain-containing protein [Streptosporangium brasiliense]MDP9861317.1 putative membrane protein YkoI [Streptosporangium brasiliense]